MLEFGTHRSGFRKSFQWFKRPVVPICKQSSPRRTGQRGSTEHYSSPYVDFESQVVKIAGAREVRESLKHPTWKIHVHVCHLFPENSHRRVVMHRVTVTVKDGWATPSEL